VLRIFLKCGLKRRRGARFVHRPGQSGERHFSIVVYICRKDTNVPDALGHVGQVVAGFKLKVLSLPPRGVGKERSLV